TGLMHCSKKLLFDDLVCECEQVWRNLDAHRRRDADVDHEQVTGRLLEWQIRRICAFEDAIDQSSGSVIEILSNTTLRHKAARANIQFAIIYGWQAFGRGVVKYMLAIENGQRVGHHQDRVWRLPVHCLECLGEIVRRSHPQRLHGDTNRSSSGGRSFVT